MAFSCRFAGYTHLRLVKYSDKSIKPHLAYIATGTKSLTYNIYSLIPDRWMHPSPPKQNFVIQRPQHNRDKIGSYKPDE
ncbi:hypothetical protein N7456_002983 [Penicillium angulare]|uniref:Uncharacterized protein n=1 Tax=Penicillium angulare TaxID=116970 RepID=A0A9W9FTX4_9EURO|nr:hypothetical protein N7456_002983 [Penicillium angulare]